jgi:hypothetical protein
LAAGLHRSLLRLQALLKGDGSIDVRPLLEVLFGASLLAPFCG